MEFSPLQVISVNDEEDIPVKDEEIRKEIADHHITLNDVDLALVNHRFQREAYATMHQQLCNVDVEKKTPRLDQGDDIVCRILFRVLKCLPGLQEIDVLTSNKWIGALEISSQFKSTAGIQFCSNGLDGLNTLFTALHKSKRQVSALRILHDGASPILTPPVLHDLAQAHNIRSYPQLNISGVCYIPKPFGQGFGSDFLATLVEIRIGLGELSGDGPDSDGSYIKSFYNILANAKGLRSIQLGPMYSVTQSRHWLVLEDWFGNCHWSQLETLGLLGITISEEDWLLSYFARHSPTLRNVYLHDCKVEDSRDWPQVMRNIRRSRFPSLQSFKLVYRHPRTGARFEQDWSAFLRREVDCES